MTAPVRPTAHPFNMYTHVRDQLQAVASVVARNREATERFAAQAAGMDRMYVVGIGTSWHAALIMEHFMRVWGGGLPAYAVHSFDFVHYAPPVTARDAVVIISHTGNKSYSVTALERANATDAPVALVAGENGASVNASMEHLLVTVPPEGSATYTISYTGALAALAQLAGAIGAARSGATTLDDDLLAIELPAAMRGALDTEGQMRELAAMHMGHRKIWLAGAGPAGITAMEAALKIKESSYLQAEGIPTEQMLHGPFQSVEPEDLMILVAPEGPGQARTIDLARETKEIGLDLIVVSDGTPEAIRELADGWVVVPAIAEPFAAITTLIPLHFLAYWMALDRGTNPDRFRLDDPRFARAYALTKL